MRTLTDIEMWKLIGPVVAGGGLFLWSHRDSVRAFALWVRALLPLLLVLTLYASWLLMNVFVEFGMHIKRVCYVFISPHQRRQFGSVSLAPA